MKAAEKLADLEQTFTSFLLNATPEQENWLRKVRAEPWTQETAEKSCLKLLVCAKQAGVHRSVAYRTIKTAVLKAGFEVPAKFQRQMLGIFRDKM